MTKVESLVEETLGVKSVATVLKEQEPEINKKIKMADDFLRQTIFPTTIVNEFLKLPNVNIDNYSSYPQWELDPYSAVIAFFYETKFIEQRFNEDNEIFDVYSAKAVGVEMRPDGLLVLHGEDSQEHPKIELTINEWKDDKNAQKNAFWMTFVSPVGLIYQVPLTSPDYELHD